MTGILLQILGLLTTGLVYNYQPLFVQQVNANQEIQQLYEDEMNRNAQEEQRQIIIEDYFKFLEKIGRIRYARGCAGGYEIPSRSEAKHKRVKCSPKSFDCGGGMKAYLVVKGITDSQGIAGMNSSSLYALGTPKDPRTAERGDFMYRRGYGDVASGNMSTHFAVVSRGYDGHSMKIYDNVNPGGVDTYGEREIRLTCNATMCHYLGKYRIYIATNGAIELAQKNNVTVQPRLDEENPNERTIAIKGYPYDSDANRIANYRYENSSGDIRMIAKFMAEAHFQTDAVGSQGEKGICQLMPNRTNNIWIKNPARNSGREYQASICLEKYKAVSNPDTIRYANEETEIPNILYLK